MVDFVCLEARLIVEMDGPLHQEPDQRVKDRKRDAALVRRGFRVLRFTDESAPGSVMEAIHDALRASPSPGV